MVWCFPFLEAGQKKSEIVLKNLSLLAEKRIHDKTALNIKDLTGIQRIKLTLKKKNWWLCPIFSYSYSLSEIKSLLMLIKYMKKKCSTKLNISNDNYLNFRSTHQNQGYMLNSGVSSPMLVSLPQLVQISKT